MPNKVNDTFFKKKLTINCNGKLIDFSEPKVMGILNITPDSFYKKSRVSEYEDIKLTVKNMVNDGVDIIDIGAVSSRPGSDFVSEDEEKKRLLPVVEIISNNFPDVIISVDTFRASIAKEAINLGAHIINDISAGELDKNMFETIAELNVPYIMMHMQGTPQTMQENPKYNDIITDIMKYFSEKILSLRKLGVKDIIVDPGLGFGKTSDDNYEIIKRLDEFKIMELPILIGASRKSMIYKLLGTTPEESLNGTTVVNTLALANNANILRVHDVKQAVETVKIFQKSSGNLN